MAGFNLGDCYRAAGLQIGADAIERRRKAFDTLRQGKDVARIADLARLYFGLNGNFEWFRDAFAAEDAAFSMVENARECAVLAAGLLEAMLEDGRTVAGLAPLSAAVAGQRKPLVRPELLKKLEQGLLALAQKHRRVGAADASLIKNPAASKAAIGEAADISRMQAAAKQISDEGAAWTKALASQVVGVVKPLIAQVDILQEEVAILWWHVGGYSRLLNKPFGELDAAVGGLMAGVDMADLSRSETGPVAANELLVRVLNGVKKTKGGKVSIEAAVEGLPSEILTDLNTGDAIRNFLDLCPVMAACNKSAENGAGAWQGGFKKATGLDPGTTMQPLDLAQQAFRERLLLCMLG